uniref:Uncharacterized protein n=1 Tax=Kalanchoe fedtschenkoi TaxID=63787 RepID=A0A7N0T0P5_KALFE
MGVRKELAWFTIMLATVMLMLQQDAATCFAAQVYYSDKFNKLRPPRHHNGRRGNADYQTVDDEAGIIFGAQKRRVFNGPNPLHNR